MNLPTFDGHLVKGILAPMEVFHEPQGIQEVSREFKLSGRAAAERPPGSLKVRRGAVRSRHRQSMLRVCVCPPHQRADHDVEQKRTCAKADVLEAEVGIEPA